MYFSRVMPMENGELMGFYRRPGERERLLFLWWKFRGRLIFTSHEPHELRRREGHRLEPSPECDFLIVIDYFLRRH